MSENDDEHPDTNVQQSIWKQHVHHVLLSHATAIAHIGHGTEGTAISPSDPSCGNLVAQDFVSVCTPCASPRG